MNKVKKDKVSGLGQLKTPASLPVGNDTKIHNMMDYAKAVGAFGASMYSTGTTMSNGAGAGSKHITLMETKNVPAPMSLKIKQSTGKKLSIQKGNKGLGPTSGR